MSRLIKGINDFKTLYPELSLEWDTKKNVDIKPETVTAHSGKKVWWKCKKCSYSWEATVANRANGRGCPFCAGKISSNDNSIAYLYPELISEWNYEKNDETTPDNVKSGSSKKVWWKCSKGHEWQAVIKSRTAGTGCPYCANKRVLSGYNDLLTNNPELAKEWNYSKNAERTPNNYTEKSSKKVWWKCANGHEWEATISSRTNGNGCPICANQKVLKGYNDLVTRNPGLAKEWNYVKNNGITPDMYMPNSNVKVWWKCSKGHEWRALISNRNLGRSCPICAKEIQTSFPEHAIVYYLKDFYPDIENTNLSAIGKELDIYIPSKKIAIEYDGVYWHRSSQKHAIETNKDRLCKENHICLYRIREKGLDKLEGSICIIRDNNNSDAGLNEVLSELFRTMGLPQIKPDVEKDRFAIIQESIHREKSNSIQKLYPLLAQEWDIIRNKGVTPDLIPAKSNHKYWWKCDKGHEWQASPNNRTGTNKNNCPYCSNHRVLFGYNDLLTLRPDLASEWNYERNGELHPKNFTTGSNKKVWWKCEKCGYEWESSISSRTNKLHPTGCYRCALEKRDINRIKKKIQILGSLETQNPQLAMQWNYEKNEGKTPDMYLPNSNTKVWWKCPSCGNEWEATINNRNKGKGCSVCSRKQNAIKRYLKVLNIDTNEIFDSMSDASQKYGINPSNLSACCRGKKKTAGGYHWKYCVEEDK